MSICSSFVMFQFNFISNKNIQMVISSVKWTTLHNPRYIPPVCSILFSFLLASCTRRMQRRRYGRFECIFGWKDGCSAIIVALKSLFALAGITDARNPTWSWNDAGKPHGYTKQIHMYGVISWAAGDHERREQEDGETRRNGRSCGYVYTITQPLLVGRES